MKNFKLFIFRNRLYVSHNIKIKTDTIASVGKAGGILKWNVAFTTAAKKKITRTNTPRFFLVAPMQQCCRKRSRAVQIAHFIRIKVRSLETDQIIQGFSSTGSYTAAEDKMARSLIYDCSWEATNIALYNFHLRQLSCKKARGWSD